MIEKDINEGIYNLLEKNITSTADAQLKELLEQYKNGLIGIAQINTKVGDILYNTKKIIQYIKHAQNIGIELVIFPQNAILGHPLEDILSRFPGLIEDNTKWLKEIAKITTKTAAIIGFVEQDENSKTYSNSVAILQNGEIKEIIQPTEVAEDANQKHCSKRFKPVFINEKKYGIITGENCFNPDDYKAFEHEDIDAFINCCNNSFDIKYEHQKNNILSEISKKYSKPIIYVNQVGTNDKLTYCGLSKVYNNEGKPLACAKPFEEQLLITNPFKKLGKIYPKTENMMFPIIQNEFSLNYDADMERTYKAIIQGIRDYFAKTGFKRAVLGLSGGLDSTVCAVLLAEALGAENVCGISMPSAITTEESMSDAQILAKNLGINFIQVPIKNMVDTTKLTLDEGFTALDNNWSCRYKKSFTSDNIQARSRAIIVWGVSNEFESCLPIATSDKSEVYMGYATINGDMSGGFAPIADVTKTKLFALARWLNKNGKIKNAIPESVIIKRPGAELAIDPNTGKPLAAEDALMPYEFMDEVIWRIEYKNQKYSDMIKSEFLYEKNHQISEEQKIQWLDKFYKRMLSALYKKSILPPYVIVDSSSISNHKQPITSGGINFRGYDEDEIKKIISSWEIL